jgi:spermidine/putrescine transport system permease protein
VILTVLPKLRRLDPDLAEAALDLGCKPMSALIKIIVPLIMPGIVSGALIAFTMSFDDFVISYFVSGNGVKNISILVYTMSKRINPTINALSTILVVIITVVLLIVNLYPILKKGSTKVME